MNRLVEAKDPGVLPFAQSVESIASVFDENNVLLADGEAFYLLPKGDLA
jgi:hypothetical protein